MVRRKGRSPYTLMQRADMRAAEQRGLSHRQIAKRFHVSRRGVDYALKAMKKSGSLLPVKQPGAPNKLTEENMREVLLAMKRDKIVLMRDIIDYIKKEFVETVSPSYVRVHLRKAGYHAYTQLKKPLIREDQKKRRLELARKWLRQGDPDWEMVIFTDETSIYRVGAAHTGKVWLPKGSASSPLRVRPTAKFGGGSLSLWAAISHQGVLSYTVFENDLTSKTYIKILKTKLLKNAAKLFAEEHWYLMHDDDPAHTATATKDFVNDEGQSRGFSVLEWPTSSPDLNPIENFWHMLKEHLARRGRAKSLDELNEWIDDAMAYFNAPEQEHYFQKLFESMPDRLRQVCKLRGGITMY